MDTDKYTYGGVDLTQAAAANIEMFEAPGARVLEDLERLRGGTTSEQFLEFCLDGTEGDEKLAQGWREYVDCLTAHVSAG